MNGLENAQHDLNDARFSLETAIELLSSIDSDTQALEPELHTVIEHLTSIKGELASSFRKLQDVSGRIKL
ncbi:MAG: hypothetical protein ACQETD_09870 [Pseudomonadota bacterium]